MPEARNMPTRPVWVTKERQREMREHALMLTHHGYKKAANLLSDLADEWYSAPVDPVEALAIASFGSGWDKATDDQRAYMLQLAHNRLRALGGFPLETT